MAFMTKAAEQYLTCMHLFVLKKKEYWLVLFNIIEINH